MAISQLDQINHTQEGVRKLRESVPGPAFDPPEAFAPKPALSAPTGPATRPTRPAISAQPAMSTQPAIPKRSLPAITSNPAPASSTQLAMPKRSFPTQAGQYARLRVNTTLHGAEQLGNMATFSARRNLGGIHDAYKGFFGEANPTEGKLVGSDFDLGRVGGRTPGADFSGVTSGVTHSPTMPKAIISDGSASSPTNPYVKPGAAPIANAAQSIGLPAGITRTLDAAGNPVYTGTGASVAAAGGPPQGATVTGQPTSFAMPQRTLPQEVVAPANQAGQYQARGRQGGIIANPNAMSALDRIRSLGSDPSLRGSPSLRKLAAEQIMQEAGFANDERQSALSTGDQADLAAVNNNAQANEAFAQRRFDASKFNVGVDLQKRELEAKQRAPFEQQPILRSLDGGTSVLRRDGTLSVLTNSDGTSFRVLDPSQRTTVSPDVEAKLLADESIALQQMPGEGSATRLAQIQQRQALLNGTAGISGITDDAVAKLRQNPKLAAEFDAKYGTGASARYLNR